MLSTSQRHRQCHSTDWLVRFQSFKPRSFVQINNWNVLNEPFSVLWSPVLHDGDSAVCGSHVHTVVRKWSSKGDYTVWSITVIRPAYFSLPSSLSGHPNRVSWYVQYFLTLGSIKLKPLTLNGILRRFLGVLFHTEASFKRARKFEAWWKP